MIYARSNHDNARKTRRTQVPAFVDKLILFFFCWDSVRCLMIHLRIISNTDYQKLKKKNPFVIHFGFGKSPFGKCLIGMFGDRICHVSFVNGTDSSNLRVLRSQWPGAHLVNNEKLTCEVIRKIFCEPEGSFKILLKGSDFEAKVWKALVRIPKGVTVSYEDVAVMVGHETAVRAAANAIAKNSVAYVVPCHRVIRKDGSVHKYQWGSQIKKDILEFEKHFF